jgi:pimeloyl-ACP methyl ester carboxylesterase
VRRSAPLDATGTSAPPVLLLHGYGMHARGWDATFDRLAEHTEVAALDFRGHGDSEWDPQARYMLATLLDDVATVIDALGWSRVVLAGHSLGGRVALHYAAQESGPGKAARLVLVDYGPELAARSVQHLRATVFGEPESYESPAEYRAWLGRVHTLALPETLDAYAAHGVRPRDDGRWVSKVDPAFRATYWSESGINEGSSEVERAQEWALVQRIFAPTLVLRGSFSSVFPARVAQRMARTELPEGGLITLEEAGHSIPIDDPAGCAEAIDRFVRASSDAAEQVAQIG